MKRLPVFAILAAASLAVAAPAFAKTSVPVGKKLCRAAAEQQQPAPVSIKVGGDNDRATNDIFEFAVKVKAADGSTAKLVCTVNRSASTASLAPVAGE